ncbi:outer membrane usher protein [Providencia alcalifaciens]|nr:outer membrane usher protein [Providencia alcalifaciens]
MVKKQYKTYNWSLSLAKAFLLKIILAFTIAAEVNGNNLLPQDIIHSQEQFADIDLYLEVTLNQKPMGLVKLGYTAGKLYSNINTLKQLGFQLNEDPSKRIFLNEIPQLNIDYNSQLQTLALTAPLSLIDLGTTELNLTEIPNPAATDARGILLNYDIYMAQDENSRINSFTELRAFHSIGVLNSTQLTQYSTEKNNNSLNNKVTRLDTNWRSSFPEQLLALTVGDSLTSALSWSRPTRIAGVQLGTDFNLQPYMPVAPIPSYFGSATLPSSIELFVDGIKYYNGEVPSGNFQLNAVPSINGAGNAQIMMTDALGRTTIQSFSFYNDQQLLREGLTDWSAELGVVRKNYGVSSFDYASTPAFSTTWRRGINNNLTVGTHSEASNQLLNIGGSSDWVPDNLGGTVSTSFALSADSQQKGWLYSIGYRWSNNKYNFSASTTATSEKYHDIASLYGTPVAALNSNVVIGYNMSSAGNVNLSYLLFRYPHEKVIRYANANWFKSVTENIIFNAGLNQNIDNSRDSSLYAMLTITIDNNVSMSSTAQRTNNKDGYLLNASQSMPTEGGIGWNLAFNQMMSQQNAQGEVGYLGRYGKVYTGFNRASEINYGYAGANGSIITMGGGLFAARTINNSFAVVSTNGVADIPIKLENNLVGTSDANGLLLLTSLNSYQNNLVSIDPTNLPANTQIPQININAVPADRSGTLVKFDIKPVRAALIILVDTQGKPITEGSFVTLNDNQSHAVVGFDGMVYFDSLKLHNKLQVTTENGLCSVQFNYPEVAEGIPQLGPFTCS